MDMSINIKTGLKFNLALNFKLNQFPFSPISRNWLSISINMTVTLKLLENTHFLF